MCPFVAKVMKEQLNARLEEQKQGLVKEQDKIHAETLSLESRWVLIAKAAKAACVPCALIDSVSFARDVLLGISAAFHRTRTIFPSLSPGRCLGLRV